MFVHKFNFKVNSTDPGIARFKRNIIVTNWKHPSRLLKLMTWGSSSPAEYQHVGCH